MKSTKDFIVQHNLLAAGVAVDELHRRGFLRSFYEKNRRCFETAERTSLGVEA